MTDADYEFDTSHRVLADAARIENQAGPTSIVPISVDGRRVYVVADVLGDVGDPGEEVEIAARPMSLESVLESLPVVKESMSVTLRAIDASFEFGAEVGIESGGVVAIIGKASGRSTFKVGMEWTSPDR